MRTVNTRDLRDNLAEYLDAVQAGERVVVTRRGNPAVELVRVAEHKPSREIADALLSGAARRPGDIAALNRLIAQPVRGKAVDLVERVLADRRD